MNTRHRGDVALLAVVTLAALAWFGSDALLRPNEAFWRATLDEGGRAVVYPLQVEARLALRQDPRTKMIALGSSVVQADVGWRRVSTQNGFARDDLLAIGLPGGQGFEFAQLASRLAALEPQRTLLFASPWLLHERVDWEGMRFYDPAMSLDLLGWRRSLGQHGFHASGLLNSTHTVLRRREALREVVFRDPRYEHPNRTLAERQARRATARPEEFSCDSLHLDALEATARTFAAAGSDVVLVSVPLNDPRLPPDAAQQLETCLEGVARRAAVRRISAHQLPAMNDGDFADYVHLNPAGRRRFTTALLELLALTD